MTRTTRAGEPVQKQPRANKAHDHSPDDRRHHHPARQPGADVERQNEARQHHGGKR